MFSSKKSDTLLAKIRNGAQLTGREKLELIVELSIPSMLAQITTVMMFFIDAAMVGHLGAAASASIGLVETTTWLMGSILSAVSLGFSVQVAHFIGANDFTRARQVFRHALVCGVAFSVLMALVGASIHQSLPYWLGGKDDIAPMSSGYFLIFSLTLPAVLLFHLMSAMLKSAGEMRVPSLLSIMMCGLDVAFNYLFIYVLKLGVVGAALGTMSAYFFTVIPMAWQAICKNKIIALRLDRTPFVWMGSYVRNAVKISFPVAVQNILMGSAQVVSTLIVAPLGNVAIAANSFAITAESLCYMPGYGVGDAATTLVGQTYGAGRSDLCKNFAHLTIGVGMLVMAFMGVVMFVFAPEMIGFLSPVEEIRLLGAMVLRIEAFAEPFFAAAIVSYAVCVASGDTLKPAAMSLFSMWCVRLTLAYVLAQSYGLRGVWVAMATELTFRGTIFLLRIRRGSWLKGIKAKA
ncbi:MAG: MATE family efflux transporter [Prevotella sp.]|uniref:Multidrug-efflux transporter n=1 Tax=Hallella faecis TaxID=2841596 RepID=A0ABV1FNJ2_9BACT|nr:MULTISPECIES: MATE family efflux transporter [Hallella]MBP6273130.1 MATE family efflux transporter [Prevotella sp.]MBS7399712.1 MATE family efflux transporter [Prevotella sp.]MBU0289170.1 MATE family efflux transporter [Hallella faecis]MDD7146231.1 MATE family efflux transporter [Hallella sp.]MDY5925805.1 MATE family efflux transporter [Hallella sp.]